MAKWTTVDRAIGGIVIVVIVVGLVCFSLEWWFGFVLKNSQHVIIAAALWAGLGIVAGIVAAHLRKKGNLTAAVTAYRFAVWLLLLSLLQVIRYPGTREREEIVTRVNETIRSLEQSTSR